MSLRAQLAALGWRVAPGAMAERARDYERRLRERVGVTALAQRFADRWGTQVLHGPFAGLQLVRERLAEIDAPTAKLLGSYEAEISPMLQAAIEAAPSRFIDLGSADGYFASGVARAAQIPVDAFELAKSARALTRETAALNGVDHLVTLHKSATTTAVAQLPLTNVLLLCDIDGGERNLFTPELVRKLETASVIIEMHSKAHPDVAQILVDRFRATHDVEVVDAVRRNPSDYSELSIFDDSDDKDHAVNELRYRWDGREWLVATPRSRSRGPSGAPPVGA